MKKMVITSLVFALTLILGFAAQPLAQGIKPPPGPHFTLNIIGVENDKVPTMTKSDRHTIFVAVDKTGRLKTTNIYLQPGYDFKVCDGNGFDAAYDCNDVQIKTYDGATFQLPCNTNPDLVYTDGFGCPDGVAQRSYAVYARALGKPGFYADMFTCATETTDFDNDGKLETFCSLDNILTLRRNTGKPVWQDATDELTTLQADINGDGKTETIALFATGFEDFFWQYDNYGLRHAQIRFYPLTE